MPSFSPPPPRRPVRRGALALAAAAALALPAAATAQEHAPAGTSASVEVLTGGDYTLELWRDDATGEIALIDTRQPEDEQVSWVRGTSLVLADADPAELIVLRFLDRRGVSDALVSLLGIDLDGVETALAAGLPAPRPERATENLELEAAIPGADHVLFENFGSAVRTLARRSTAPVAWAGPRRFGFRLRQATLTEWEDVSGRRGPYAAVTYARGPVAVPGHCDGCFSVASARVGSVAARDLIGGRAFTTRIAGRPALRTGTGHVVVRLGPLVVSVNDLGTRRTRELVRSLRIVRA